MIFRKNGMLLSGQHIQFFHVNTVGNAVCPDHFSAKFKIHPFYFLHLFSLKPHLLRFYICPHTVDITNLVIHKIPAVKHIPVEDSPPVISRITFSLYRQRKFVAIMAVPASERNIKRRSRRIRLCGLLRFPEFL